MNDTPRNLCVLFADVVGSSRLYERLGDSEAHHAVERCLNRMERAAAACKGRVIKTVGDELMVAFDSAESAVLAAGEMQQRVALLPPVSGMALAIRIGSHYGPVLDRGNDLFGDTVNVASRLASLANPRQTLTTAEMVNLLPPSLQDGTRPLDALPIRGRDLAVRVFEIVWNRNDEDLTMEVRVPSAVTSPQEPRLCLRYDGRETTLGPDCPVASLGRDAGSDIVIRDSRASRSHGRIEYRRGRYVLVDQSTNGTYVTFVGGDEFALKREDTVLRGRGHIRFGHSTGAGEPGDPLEFEILN